SAFTTAISQLSDRIDSHRPIITDAPISIRRMTSSSEDTRTIKVTSDADTYTLGNSNIDRFTLSSLTKTSNTTYRAQFTVTSGGTDVAAASNIPLSVTLVDSAGNAGSAFTTAISQLSDRIDAHRPIVTDAQISIRGGTS